MYLIIIKYMLGKYNGPYADGGSDTPKDSSSSASKDDPITNPDYYSPINNEPTKKDTKVFREKVGVILGAIQAIGSILSVLALVVIGIKYMLGSAEEKANYKQTMIPYIIGVILVFSSSTLVNAIYKAIY